jgi:hypothetical protein
VAKVYVNRLELSVAENLLASADGTIGASNDSCLQLKHSPRAAHRGNYATTTGGDVASEELTRVVPSLERTELVRAAVLPKWRPHRRSPTLQSRLPIGRPN